MYQTIILVISGLQILRTVARPAKAACEPLEGRRLLTVWVFFEGGGGGTEGDNTSVNVHAYWEDAPGTINVGFNVGGGSATSADHTLASNSVELTNPWPNLYPSTTIPLTLKKDNLVEGGESFTITLQGGSGYEVGYPPQWNIPPEYPGTTATIGISDDPPKVWLTKLEDGSEDPDTTSSSLVAKPAKFLVTRTGGDPNTRIDVPYTITGHGNHAASSSDHGGADDTISLLLSQIISVPVQDDSEIEFREGMLLALNPAANTFLLGDPNGEEEVAEIADNDFTIKTASVGFADQGIKRDTDTQEVYDSKQWDDTDGDGKSNVRGLNIATIADAGYPISYERSVPGAANFVNALAGFSIEYKDANVLGGTFVIEGAGSGPGGGTFTGAANAVAGQNGLSATISGNYPSNTALPETIKAGALEIDWNVKRTVGQKVKTVVYGRSKNRIYVTGAAAPDAFETVLELGSTGADGKRPDTDVQGVLDGVWSKFAGPANVERVDGTPMTYYGNWNTKNEAASTLLKHADGQCAAWTRLLWATLNSQGVVVGIDYVLLEPDPATTNGARGFIIKNWTFNGAGTSGNPLFPYVNTFLNNHYDASGFTWATSEVTDNAGIPGQNTANPLSLFRNHQMLKITVGTTTKYYDPSYGKIFNNLGEFDSEISGYYMRTEFNWGSAFFFAKNTVADANHIKEVPNPPGISPT